ncbi:MAG: hypothetical protein AAGG55_04210 [Pseudomonadota bacterium]
MRQKLSMSLVMAFALGALATAVILRPEMFAPILRLGNAHANASLYAPRDWSRGTPSNLNISVFVYADHNRNGVYDMPDRPLAGIASRLTRPDGRARLTRSNVNGFTNFGMQLGSADADITEVEKDYDFEVLPPPDWTVTSGDARQLVRFKAVEGAVAGLAAYQAPSAVGLAPPSRVSGRLPEALRQASITASNAAGDVVKTHTENGSFSLELTAGDWELAFSDNETDTHWGRRVSMADTPIVLSPLTGPGAAKKPLLTIDFDDRDHSFIDKIPNGYQGLEWNYLLAVDNQYYKGPGYVNGLRSGANVAYNSSGHPVTISAIEGESFNFHGGFFSVAWLNAEGEVLGVRAWRGEELVYEDKLSLSHLHPTFYQAELRDITKLELATDHYWQFVVDDLQLRP